MSTTSAGKINSRGTGATPQLKSLKALGQGMDGFKRKCHLTHLKLSLPGDAPGSGLRAVRQELPSRHSRSYVDSEAAGLVTSESSRAQTPEDSVQGEEL